MKINYNNKTFRPVENTENGETSGETLFHYQQTGTIVTANYSGGAILTGHLLAVADADGNLTMRYHQINKNGELMTGKCVSVPEILPDGRLRLHETWEWTSGDCSAGKSVIEEVV